jgi:hypothetical protein
MTRDELLKRLSKLGPPQFDTVLFQAEVPLEYLSGPNAPQATRATEVVRYFEQHDQLSRLAQIVVEVAGPDPQ